MKDNFVIREETVFLKSENFEIFVKDNNNWNYFYWEINS
jgi:hypothetical protein